ncbi:MAG: site-2 protease family protein [Candidatus Baltobacteraceae bacterium]
MIEPFAQPHAASEPIEGEYQPPGSGKPSAWKRAGAAAVGIGLLFAKFKGLLFFLLNIKWILIGSKVLLSSLSFLASIWVYALLWGWKFGIAFTLLLLVHELGHMIFMRAFGIPATLPYFIPGLGAFVAMKGRPASVLAQAYIALGGPFVGSICALAAGAYGAATGEPFWIAVAYTGFFINLFNLFPVLPLDGGQIVGAISPRIWIVGLVALVVAAVAFHWFNPLIFILILLSIPQAVAAFRGQLDQRYFTLTTPQRFGVACAYFGLAGLLFCAMLAARVPPVAHNLG